MNESLRKSSTPEQIAQLMDVAYQDPVLCDAYERRYWPQIPGFHELWAMPDESFGRQYADFILRYNLDVDVFPQPVFSSRPEYLLSRIYQAHDAWHVLTGYTPAIEDELALQAFGAGQYHQPISVLIVAGGLMHILKCDPEKGEAALRAVSLGYERGRLARNLLTHPVLERMAEPLDLVRSDLGLSAV